MKTISIAIFALLCNIATATQAPIHDLTLLQRPSDEIADGDSADDKELEDVNDPEDIIADDTGFGRNWVQLKSQVRKESDEIADGDAADDKEIEDETDPEDPVVDDHGFVRNYKYLMTESVIARNGRPIDNQHLMYQVNRYSEEIANGDSADDKDLHEEEDVNDAVVDINGSGKARYGSAVPVDYFAGNHIFADHFGTIPRED